MEQNYEALKLEKQLCFPLYACSRHMIRLYKPFLDKLELTYTQYITMMVLWDRKAVTVKERGTEWYLGSGTLTPLLKKLEERGLVTRRRSEADERNLIVTVTEKGMALRDPALPIPEEMTKCINLEKDEIRVLYRTLYKMLEYVKE